MKTIDTKSSLLANVLVPIISIAWLWLLTSNTVLKIGQLKVIIVAYAFSCTGLIIGIRTCTKLNLFSNSACSLVASLLAFIVWADCITAVSPSALVANVPHVMRFAILALPGIVSILGVVAVLVLPIALLPNRAIWIVPIGAMIFAIIVEFLVLFDQKQSLFSLVISVFELLCLGLAVPLILNRLTPKVRRAIENMIQS
jgi:hypothetical protein